MTSHLDCTTVAPWTFRWCNKTVNVIGPTVDHGDVQYESGTAIGQLGKQTLLEISPSSIEGWSSFNQPKRTVLHVCRPMHLSGILVPAAPTKRIVRQHCKERTYPMKKINV